MATDIVQDTNNTEVKQTSEVQQNEEVVQDTKPEEDKNWKATREHIKKLEKKLQAYEDEKKQEEEAKMKAQGEYQQLLETREKELAEFKTRIRTTNAQKQLATELAKQNIRPEAIELVEAQALKKAEIDEDGNITNVGDILVDISTNYSFLFDNKPGSKTPPVVTSTQQSQTMTFENIKNMSASERPKDWINQIIKK